MKKKWPYFVLIFFGILLFLRSFFSFCWSDESFYLATVHRLWLGEQMIVGEWHPTQFYAVLLLPLYRLYMFVMKGNEGVYLAARLTYLFISLGVAFYIYHVLQQRKSAFVALSSALIYLLYIRGNIGGLSYYSLMVTFCTLALFIIYNGVLKQHFKCTSCMSVGILLGLATVCMPTIGLLYVLACIILWIKASKSRHSLLQVLLGTILSAVIYLIYLLQHVSVSEILTHLPYVLSDPEHCRQSLPITCIKYFYLIAKNYILTLIFIVPLTGFIGYRRLIQKQQLTAQAQLNAFVVICLAFVVSLVHLPTLMGSVLVSLTLCTLPCLLLTYPASLENKLDIWVLFVPGIALTFGVYLSSNTGIDAMTMGFVIAAMGSILILDTFIRGLIKIRSHVKRRIQVAFSGILIVTVSLTAFLRIAGVYRDDSLTHLTTRLTAGPAKGLYTSARHAAQYHEVYRTIETYMNHEAGDYVFFTRLLPWGYLCTTKKCGAPTAWRTDFNSPRLEMYYNQLESHLPQQILVLNGTYGAYTSPFNQSGGDEAAPNVNEISGVLTTYPYTFTVLPCGTLYRLQNN